MGGIAAVTILSTHHAFARPLPPPRCTRQWQLGREPVSLTAFGTTMTGELGVVYGERSKRELYVGLAMVSAPKLDPAA